jgi:(p)ppGpp synthase/HD superfamily hydrolase
MIKDIPFEKYVFGNTLLTSAKHFAFAAHGAIGHRRKYTDLPYFTHCESVAKRIYYGVALHDIGPLLPLCITAAYLHDVVEDAAITIEDIEAHFGKTVAKIVGDLTTVKIEKETRSERKERERIRLSEAFVYSHIVKAYDIIDNVETIRERDPEFAKKYLAEKRTLVEHLTKLPKDLKQELLHAVT